MLSSHSSASTVNSAVYLCKYKGQLFVLKLVINMHEFPQLDLEREHGKMSGACCT